MEKLIELFKEYVDNHWFDTKDIEKEYWVIEYWQWFLYWTREYLYEIIVSKQFWFIKWLVDNDKINKDLISRVLIRAYVSPENHVSLECEFHDYYESLLMLLSIQDDPIKLLLSILK